MSERRRSNAEERSFARMIDQLESQEAGFERFKRSRSLVPPGWHAVERRAEIKPKKVKLNVALDADVVTWFRALGRGGQPRRNAILRAYMHTVISKEIEQKGGRDWRGGEGGGTDLPFVGCAFCAPFTRVGAWGRCAGCAPYASTFSIRRT